MEDNEDNEDKTILSFQQLTIIIWTYQHFGGQIRIPSSFYLVLFVCSSFKGNDFKDEA